MKRLLVNLVVLGLVVLLMGAGRIGRTPATPDHAVAGRGETVEVDVLANDTHLGGDLQLHSVSHPGNRGVATKVGNRVHFTVHPDAVAGDAVVHYVVRTPAGSHHAGRLTVNVSVPNMLLQGEVAYAAPGCDIAVVIDGARYPGCVSGEAFSIEVPTDDLDSVVTIESDLGSSFNISAGSQRMTSILGSLGHLAERAEHAGTPYVLTSADFGPLRVNEFTTAHHTLLLQRHGPGLLHGDQARASAEKFIDIHRVQQFVDLLRGARLEAISALPAGVRDVVDLAGDLDALSAFHALNFAEVEGIRQHLHSYAGAHPWPADMAHQPLLSPQPSLPGTISPSFLHGQQVIVGEVGQARVYDLFANAGSGAVTALDYSGLSVATDHGIPQSRSSLIQCPEGDQLFEFRYSSQLQSLNRVLEGLGADIAIASNLLVLENSHQVPSDCTHTMPYTEWNLQVRQVVSQRHLRPVAPVAGLGRWAVRLPAPAPGTINDAYNNAGIIDFGAQTVDAPGFLPDMVVAANDIGGMDLSLQASGDAGLHTIDMQLFRARADGQGGELWMGNADNATLGSVGVGGLAAPVTHPDLFADATAAHGVWRSGFRVGTLGMVADIGSELLFELQPGSPGIGTRYSFVPGGVVNALPVGWEIDGDNVVVMTTWQSLVDGRLHAWCPVGDECYPWQRRTWQPVSLSSTGAGPDRLYVIEELYIGSFGELDPPLLSRRVNFYESAVVPEQAPPPAPPAPTRARMR